MLKLPIAIQEFTSRLLNWYRDNLRELPWRTEPSFYRVWVSEVMLQQTQVKTVVPRFEQFLATYPTLEALARAEESEILATWAGLGYYNRARNLHKAAQIVRERHAGEFPRDYDQALQLPGVGRYTAGAILSIAFGDPLPILDNNIRRLLTRYLRILDSPPPSNTGDYWKLLDWMVQQPPVSANISDFNQGLMELGSLICRVRNPLCSACPLSESCIAFKEGIQDTLPNPKKRRPVRNFDYTVALIRRNGRYLFNQDSNTSFLAGFWEFPRVAGQPNRQITRRFREAHGLDLRVEGRVAKITHQITDHKLHFHALSATLERPVAAGDFRWMDPNQDQYPVSTYVRKIFAKCGVLS